MQYKRKQTRRQTLTSTFSSLRSSKTVSILSLLLIIIVATIGTTPYTAYTRKSVADPLAFAGSFTSAPAGNQDLSAILGLNIHDVWHPAVLDAVKAMGVTWVRTDLFWRAAEKSPGVYIFSDWDSGYMSNLKARGLKALAILGYGNPLYTGGTGEGNPPTTSSEITAYANYAKAAASHFRGDGVRYELYNEPNGSGGIFPAAAYAQLSNQATAAIHAADPTALVTTGGLEANLEYPNPPIKYMGSVLANDGAQGTNAVAWHAYQFGGDPETVMSRESIWNATIKQHLPKNAPPTWQTEAGYRALDLGGSTQAQAGHIIRMILSQWAAGFKMIIVYSWDDDVGYALQGTPSVGAITYLTSVTKGRSFVSYAMPSDSTAWYAVRLESATDIIGIVWLRSGQKTALLPSGTTATDMYGHALPLAPSGGQLSLTWSAASGPVYLKFPPKISM